MSDKDYIKDLFQSRLGQHETPVDPSIWAGIQSQLPAAGATASSGVSLVSKLLIGFSSAAVLTTAAVFLLKDSNESKSNKISDNKPNQERVVIEAPEKESPVNTLKTNSSESNIIENQSNFGNTINDQTTYKLDVNDPIDTQGNQDFEKPTDHRSERLTVEDDPYRKVEANAPTDVPNSVSDKAVNDTDQTEHNGVQTGEQEADKSFTKIELPDIFTPNADFQNDELFIKSYNLHDFSMVVLDQMNQIVYQTNDPNFRWNGLDIYGNPVPDGNYIYMVTAYDQNDLPVSASSMLRIVR